MADPYADIASPVDPYAAFSSPAQKRKPGVVEDVAKGGATGLGQGIVAPLGIRGDAANLINLGAHGIGALVNKVAPGYGDVISGLADAGARIPSSVGGVMNPLRGVSSGDVQQATGLTYQAQTLPGKIAQKVGQFAPAALAPGSAGQRAVSVALPAAGAVAGREIPKAMGAGEGGQAVGEFIGSLAGGLGAGAKLPKIQPKVKAPSLEELQTARTAAYKAVDDMGVTYKPEAVNSLVQGVNDALKAEEIDPDLHRLSTALARKVNGLADQPVTLTRLDKVRRVVGNAIVDKATTKDDRRLLYSIRDNIDEFIGAAGPEQITTSTGDPAAASALIKQARELHQRTAKIERIQEAQTTAKERTASTFAGGNIDNATRQELRKVLKYQRNYSPDELEQLKSAVYGDPMQNALRLGGKFSPTGNGLNLILQGTAGVATHGATIPLAVAGFAAKSTADAITRSKVLGLMDTMARGGKRAVKAENTLAQLAKGNPQARLAYQQVAKRLLLTGGLATSAALAPSQSAATARPAGR